ncbi:MAG: bifunctional (p)ppGpp synthetase/guanosine-3',5'-bis(diphosphate) 3'-pyrophosphohydrolase [Myxococcales bacterium]|nr:bifunctional (p)ppGpp synthetase/guanosine-3',5'-bis(diphosphate) 3'-pyrophosphohydrolase [Myxococcales bacterium]
MGLVLRAARYAAHQHRDQRRKGHGKRPYVNHCLDVADLLVRVGGVDDPTLLAGAILHDVVEDTDATEDDVRRLFGDAVADLVMEVTDDKSLPKAERKRLQEAHAAHKSPSARLLKLADKISNLRDLVADPPDWPAARCLEYVAWARRVVAPMRAASPALAALFDEVASDAELRWA